MRKVFLCLLTLMIYAAFVPLSGCSADPGHTKRALEEAPDFTREIVQGGELTLSDKRGEVVILGFWATWCPPCRREIPHFQALHEEYADKGLVLVGASLDDISRDEMEDFIDRYGITYPIVMASRRMSADYGGITSVPTTFIIDRYGRMVEVVRGFRDKQYFEERIKKLL